MTDRWFPILMLVALGSSLAAATVRGEATLDPAVQLTQQVGIRPALGTQVPLDLDFVDAEGKTIRLGDLVDDRPVLLHLVYYECPMLCRLSSDGVMKAMETVTLEPGKDFTVVTLSFDPREGPELSARARAMAIERCGPECVENAWHFLTGAEPQIKLLCESVGFRYAWDDQTMQYAHATGVFVLTPEGKLSRFLSGIEFSPRDLRLSLVEASNGKIGSAADQVMLLCYMYDPTTGKYGMAVITAIRVAGAATVGILAASIFTMLRRERQQNSPSPVGRGQGEGAPDDMVSTFTPTLSQRERGSD